MHSVQKPGIEEDAGLPTEFGSRERIPVMSEPVVGPTRVVGTSREASATSAVIAAMSLGGREVRIDGPEAGDDSAPRFQGRAAQFMEQLVADVKFLDAREAELQRQAERLEVDRLAFRQQQAHQRDDIRRDLHLLQEQQSVMALRQRELELHVAALAAAERQLETDRQAWRSALLEEMEAERTELLNLRNQLSEEREAVAQLQAQRQEFQRERVLLENRLRFQQEHLDKVRAELEQAQNEFRAERQRERQQLEDDTLQIQRQQQQLRIYRATLDELARAVDREHDTVLKCREAWSSTVDGDRQAVQAERELWDQERQRQRTELHRQQELLIQQGEQLEGRRLRLERLRAEMEDTHRITLELRLAVEETWAQVAHASGSEEQARVQVEQARQALVLYYQQLHIALEDHRRELSEQQARFDEQRSDFHEERQTVLHWLNERDERLRAEEARQLVAATELTHRDAAWREARDHWLAEKLEAERVIRNLVNQLADDSPLSRAA